ncbi:MAG: hypothetical protein QOE33_2350 [Acidobacteriota bacterium]|nr:hypothetical protein [Acidobacteriota bacterium]
MRTFMFAITIVCACDAATFAQHGRLPVSLPTPQPTSTPGRDEPPAPTLKKPDKLEVEPSHSRHAYDAAHDTTYVNIDIALVSHVERKLSAGALAFEGRDLVLTFQLAYGGKRTDDLRAAYIVLESTSAPGDTGDHLSNARRLELQADAYEYSYERTDYKTGIAAQTGAALKNAPPLRREIAIFRIETADLSEISFANRLELKLGTENFTVKSPQLADLRRALATGDKH